MAAVALGACTSESADQPPTVRAADAYLAIVEWQVDSAGPLTTGESLPVVYITAEDGQTIDAGVQAKVAQNSVDVAKVRFADARGDALDTHTDGEPVKDDGVLLIVDPFDAKGAVDVPIGVTVYHSADDQQHLVFVVSATDAGAQVTSSSVRPSG